MDRAAVLTRAEWITVLVGLERIGALVGAQVNDLDPERLQFRALAEGRHIVIPAPSEELLARCRLAMLPGPRAASTRIDCLRELLSMIEGRT